MVISEKNVTNIRKQLAGELKPEIYRHSLRTAETARELAKIHQSAPQKAYLAGLLHDYCRGWPRERLLKLLQDSRWQPDRWERQPGRLLHAPAAAEMAEKKFNLTDMSLLRAIRYHTISNPQSDRLGMIVYLADKIEPDREYFEAEEIKKLAGEDLNQALLASADSTIRYLLDSNVIIHPNIIILRNNLLGG